MVLFTPQGLLKVLSLLTNKKCVELIINNASINQVASKLVRKIFLINNVY